MNVYIVGPNTKAKECNLAFLGSLDIFPSNIFLTTLKFENKYNAFIKFVEDYLRIL